MEDAAESLLLTLLRDGARGMVSPPGRSPMRPGRLPISVAVRNIDMTPGADARESCLPVLPECLWVALDMADMLDALLVRPLAFGSRSASIVGKLTAQPVGLSGIEEASADSRYCLRVFLLRGEKAVAGVFDTGGRTGGDMCGRLSKSKRVTAAPPHHSYDPKKERMRNECGRKGSAEEWNQKEARQVEEMLCSVMSCVQGGFRSDCPKASAAREANDGVHELQLHMENGRRDEKDAVADIENTYMATRTVCTRKQKITTVSIIQ
jgi:hypothetical protein